MKKKPAPVSNRTGLLFSSYLNVTLITSFTIGTEYFSTLTSCIGFFSGVCGAPPKAPWLFPAPGY